MKTYLVTGGAGFIGSNFILHMLSRYSDILLVNLDKLSYAGNPENLLSAVGDARYRFVQGDICDAVLTERLFREYSFDYVVNLAAESHVDRSLASPDIFLETNVFGTVNLLNTVKEAWSLGEGGYREDCKFLQISTDEVYGSLGAGGFFTEQSPLDPHSPYSASKASADIYVRAYAATYGLPINITRCSNNYGPRQFPEKLIPLMIVNALKHSHLPVYGDGLQVRDWLYVGDHCTAIDMVLHCGTVGEVYNIGGSNEHTNLEVVERIVEYIHCRIDSAVDTSLITHTADRMGHDRRYGIDAAKLRNELGWKPEMDFEAGLVGTIEWYAGICANGE